MSSFSYTAKSNAELSSELLSRPADSDKIILEFLKQRLEEKKASGIPLDGTAKQILSSLPDSIFRYNQSRAELLKERDERNNLPLLELFKFEHRKTQYEETLSFKIPIELHFSSVLHKLNQTKINPNNPNSSRLLHLNYNFETPDLDFELLDRISLTIHSDIDPVDSLARQKECLEQKMCSKPLAPTVAGLVGMALLKLHQKQEKLYLGTFPKRFENVTCHAVTTEDGVILDTGGIGVFWMRQKESPSFPLVLNSGTIQRPATTKPLSDSLDSLLKRIQNDAVNLDEALFEYISSRLSSSEVFTNTREFSNVIKYGKDLLVFEPVSIEIVFPQLRKIMRDLCSDSQNRSESVTRVIDSTRYPQDREFNTQQQDWKKRIGDGPFDEAKANIFISILQEIVDTTLNSKREINEDIYIKFSEKLAMFRQLLNLDATYLQLRGPLLIAARADEDYVQKICTI